MPTQARLSIPALAGAAIVIGLLVVGGILLVGSLGTTQPEPSPSLQASPSIAPTATATATDPPSTPEGAVRAFFAAFAAARRSDDPSAIVTLVTGTDSSAYLSVAGFLAGQKDLGKASILTEQRLENLRATTIGATATVTFDYTEIGYDISLPAAAPLQSPQVLPSVHVTVHLAQVGSAWLVDAYESAP